MIVILAFASIVAIAPPAMAQRSHSVEQAKSTKVKNVQAPHISDPFVHDTNSRLEAYSKTLANITAQISTTSLNDDVLAELQSKLGQIESSLANIESDIQSRLIGARAQLAELGNAPGPGEALEPAVTSQERNQLLSDRSGINAVADKANKLATSVREAINAITKLRREQFTEALFTHTDLSKLLTTDYAPILQNEIVSFKESYGGWFTFIWQVKRIQFMVAIILSLLAAMVAYYLSSRFVARSTLDLGEENPEYPERLLAAFWATTIPSLALLAFLSVSYVLFVGMNILLPDVELFVRAAYIAGVIIVFVFLLSRNVLAPARPQRRLIPVGNVAARNLTLAFTALACINWIDLLIGTLSETLHGDVLLEALRSFISSILIGVILIAVSFIRFRASPDNARQIRAYGLLLPRVIAVMVRLAGLFVVFSALIGYVALARFLAMQIVLTGAVLITMYIGMLVGQAVSQPGNLVRNSFGKRFVERFGLSTIRTDQISLLLGLLTYTITLFVGIPLVLLSWGVRYEEIQLWAIEHLTAVTIGSVTISLGGILIGIALFAGGFLATRWFEGWFDNNVLLRSRADAGVRNSVKTGISYLGILLAVLLGVSAAGLNLSSLALMASALSIGIGFGLQTIVSNFVSGLILLVERPFKVGDWIISGSTEGFVKRISVRATEIETFQRQSIIVPNSELINASVGNWTHHNQMGRSEIAVGVSYNSDPRQVMEILMDIGTRHPLVLQNPEPMVIFVGFGSSALDFELRVYLADVFTGISVRNDIRLAIFERFQAAGISIPVPQRDLHIIGNNDDDRTDPLTVALAGKGQSQKPVNKKSVDKKPTRTKKENEPLEYTFSSKATYDHPDVGNDDGGDR